MASFSTMTDITKPIETGGWTQLPWKKDSLTMEQSSFMEAVANMEVDSDGVQDERMASDNGEWKIVTKKGNKDSNPEAIKSTMKKVKVTVMIRAPRNTSEFPPAKLHIDTLHEIHKFDDTLLVFNLSGDTRVNIEAPMSEARYKETFKPVEKRQGNNSVSTVSIAHDMYLTGKANECKEAIFPFLKKNKIFLYFNPKPGLEHFHGNRCPLRPKSRLHMERRTCGSADRHDEI
jgi:hypothetical protein